MIGDILAGFGSWSPAAWLGAIGGVALWVAQHRGRAPRPRRLVSVSSMAEAVPVVASLPVGHPFRGQVVEHWCSGCDGLVVEGDMGWDEGRWLCRSCIGARAKAA